MEFDFLNFTKMPGKLGAALLRFSSKADNNS